MRKLNHLPAPNGRRVAVAILAVGVACGLAPGSARADEAAREKELAVRAAAERALKEQALKQNAEADVAVQVQVQVLNVQAVRPQVFAQPGAAIDLTTAFDQVVFGNGGGNPVAPDADTAARLSQVRKSGEARIEQIDRVVRLSADQRAKLRVAMEADVSRLAEEIDGIRAGYVGRKVTIGEDGAGQEEVQKVNQAAVECRRLMAAVFGPTALLSKVLGDTLDPPQFKLYTETITARRGRIWKALIGSALLAHDGVLGLTQSQHEAVEALLMADVPPLALELAGQRAVGTAMAPAGLVVLRLEQTGDDKLAAVLDPRQRAVVRALARQLGEPADLQAQLVAGGLLEDNP